METGTLNFHIPIKSSVELTSFCYIVTYADSHLHTCTYICRIIHNDTMITTDTWRKTQEDFFTNIFTFHFIARVRKGCVGFYCEREMETEHKLQYFDPTVMTVTLCFSCSLGLLNRRPRAHSAGCWLSLLHLISIFSGPQLIRAQRPLRPDVAFPTTFRLQLSGTLLATVSTLVLTALYNSSTPTRSPTRSFKSNV